MLNPPLLEIHKNQPVCQYPRLSYNRIAAIINNLQNGRGINIVRDGDKWTISVDKKWLAGFIESLVSPEIDAAENESSLNSNGVDGVGISAIAAGTPTVANNKTTTPITVTLTDNTTRSFNVTAQNGAKGDDGEDGEDGADGVGISAIAAGTATVDGTKTTTPITVTLTDNTTKSFNVTAQNGAQGPQGPQGPAGPTTKTSVRVLTGLSYDTTTGELHATYEYIYCQGKNTSEGSEDDTVFTTVPELP